MEKNTETMQDNVYLVDLEPVESRLNALEARLKEVETVLHKFKMMKV